MNKPTRLYFTDEERLNFLAGYKAFGYEKENEDAKNPINLIESESEEHLGNGKWRVLKKV